VNASHGPAWRGYDRVEARGRSAKTPGRELSRKRRVAVGRSAAGGTDGRVFAAVRSAATVEYGAVVWPMPPQDRGFVIGPIPWGWKMGGDRASSEQVEPGGTLANGTGFRPNSPGRGAGLPEGTTARLFRGRERVQN